MSLFKAGNNNCGNNRLSPFRAMSTALAGAIGTGNIVGVAGALSLGGAGAIFWMWIAAVFGMATIFAENVLGVKYREKHPEGYVGGPVLFWGASAFLPRYAVLYSPSLWVLLFSAA